MYPLSRFEQDNWSAGRSGQYLSEDTIASLVSAVGGAISVVRVSGPHALQILEKLTCLDSRDPQGARRLHFCKIINGDGEVLDEGMVAYFRSPHSFTGEDCVEFHIHGGAFLARRLLNVLYDQGARQALPGEFSFRAVRNGKMTLGQVEAVADLIASKNRTAATLALEKLGGLQGRFTQEVSEALRQALALSEAHIDFSDQDIEETNLTKLKKTVQQVLLPLERLRDSFERGIKIQEGLSVTFVGLPNAGKSSFFNALLGEERALVSEIPGTTRDILREHLVLQGKLGQSVTLNLQDTAGLHNTTSAVEEMGIERAFKIAQESDLIFLVVDAAAPLAPLFEEWKKLKLNPRQTIGIFSKIDCVAEKDILSAKKALQPLSLPCWLQVSSKTGEGLHEAVQAVVEFCDRWVHREPREVILTRWDQVSAVSGAISHLNRALEAHAIELFSADLKQALHCLGPLIGETLPDDILERIFSQFCIGK